MELLRFQVSRLVQTALSTEKILPRFSRVLSRLAEHVIVQRLEKIRSSQLLLIYPDGRQRIVGLGSEHSVELSIHSEDFWTRVLLYADMVYCR